MRRGLRFRPEEPSDATVIRSLVEAAFKGEAEADLLDRLRRDGDLTLSLIALDDNPVGHIAFSPLKLHDSPNARGLALGPLAVRPEFQRLGIGTALIEESLRHLRESGVDLILVLGDPGFYSRFGFTVEAARAFQTPYDGPHLQALPLSKAVRHARGPVGYAPAFSGLP